MRKFLTSIAIVFALTGTAHSQDFQKGLTAALAGDFETAHQERRPLAQQGDAGAQTNLAFMYNTGQGVPQDHEKAAKWYRKAAEQGLAYAQFSLGVMYRKGNGVPKDNYEAVKANRPTNELVEFDL